MSRRVRQLHVRAPDTASAERFRVALREALRTASIPGDDGPGCVWIERLDLGRVPADLGVPELAARLRRVIEAQLASIRPIAAPDVEAATIVHARDEEEALAIVAERAARGLPLDAWIWRAVLPEVRTHTRSEVLRLVHRRLLVARHGIATLVSLVAALVERGTVEPFAEVIDEDAARTGLARLPPRFELARLADALELRAIAAAPAWRSLVQTSRGRTVDDPRVVWLAALALAADHAPRLADPLLGARAVALARMFVEAAAPRGAVERREEVATADTPASDEAIEAAHARAPRPATPAPPRPARAPFEGARTDWGGLYFFIAVLERLGLGALFATHPELTERDFGRRLLAALADQLDVPPDDPVRAPLVDPPLGTTPLPTLAPPARWAPLGLATDGDASDGDASDGDASDGDASDGDGDRTPSLVASWCAAVARWLEVYGAIDVHTVALRPARVAMTRTHVDVELDLDGADVRIRRLGLDVDPGWVPWLGRVVAFAYVRDPALTPTAR